MIRGDHIFNGLFDETILIAQPDNITDGTNKRFLGDGLWPQCVLPDGLTAVGGSNLDDWAPVPIARSAITELLVSPDRCETVTFCSRSRMNLATNLASMIVPIWLTLSGETQHCTNLDQVHVELSSSAFFSGGRSNSDSSSSSSIGMAVESRSMISVRHRISSGPVFFRPERNI
jgi:hypothetical protein